MNEQELLETLQEALKNGEYDRVENLAKEAVKTYPESAFGYAYLAESMLMEVPTRYAEAELCLAKAAQLEPQNATYLSQFAAIKSAQGDEGAAQLLWGKILSFEPENTDALVAKGSYQLRVNNDYEQAIELFNQALSLDLEFVAGYLFRAEAYLGLEDYDKALNDVQQALALQGDAPEAAALLLKIDVLQSMGDKTAAAALYPSVLELEPEEGAHRVNYGQLLFELTQYAEAAEQLAKATELLGDNDPMIAYLLGDALFQSQQYTKAIDAYTIYIDQVEAPAEGLLMRIDCHMALSQYDSVLADVKRLEQAADDDPSLLERATLKRGAALAGLERFDEARELLTPLAQKPSLQQGAALFELGVLEHRSGNGPKAYQFVKAAKKQRYAPANSYLNESLAEVEQQLLEKAFEVNAAGIEGNAASAFVGQIKGQVWTYKDFQSQKLDGFSPEQVANVKAMLSSYTVLISDQALVLLSDQAETLATYRIQKEVASGMLIELLPIDNSAPTSIKLQLTKQGWLTYSKEKGEVIVLEAAAYDTLPAKTKELYQAHFSADRLALLGQEALAKALF